MKFEIKNRWSGKVQFSAEIECGDDTPHRVKIGLAVRWAFSSGADLSDADLSDADLSDADLSGADLSDADLSDADLSDADLSGADLSDADLSGAVLRGADLSGAVLRDADLSGAVLRGAVLSGAVLRGADLSGAVLRGAVLRGAPIIENIHQRIYEAASQPNALNMGNWHSCDTTHCQAGWVVTLAGESGRKLEDQIGTSGAATLIYLASDPKLDRVPNFYASNDEALEDMKRLADAERGAAP